MQDGLGTGVSAADDARMQQLASEGVIIYDPSEHPPEKDTFFKRVRRAVNHVADSVRHVTPSGIVNSGSQINFTMRAAADGMSIWSSVREGSQSKARLMGSFVTMFAEVLGIFFKDKPVTTEERETYKRSSWPDYFWLKTKQALNPKEHIGETYGLAAMVHGAFSLASGAGQSSSKKMSWEVLQGLLTMLAGGFMTYMPSREKAWQYASLTFLTRAPIAGMQAHQAYFHGYPDKNIAKGDWQQGARFALNELSGIFGFFYGGIKKLPDGTIVRIANKEHQRILAQEDAYDRSPVPLPDSAQGPATRVSNVMAADAENDKDKSAVAARVT